MEEIDVLENKLRVLKRQKTKKEALVKVHELFKSDDFLVKTRKLFESAEITMVTAEEYNRESCCSFQNMRYPVMFTVTTTQFTLQYRGTNNWHDMKLHHVESGKVLRWKDLSIFVKHGETEFYGLDEEPLPLIISKITANDNLMNTLPIYGSIFRGLFDAFISAYVLHNTEAECLMQMLADKYFM